MDVIISLIWFDNDFEFIQPKLPLFLEDVDILNLIAAAEKPFLLISSCTSFILFLLSFSLANISISEILNSLKFEFFSSNFLIHH